MLLTLLTGASVGTAAGAARTPLYVGGLFELTEHWWSRYTNLFPLVLQRAFDELKNRSDILQGYEIQLVSKDTQVGILFI